MTDEKLIKLVKRYPALYDTNSRQYRDHDSRNSAWEEIAEQLHTTAENCKERWARLRNCFTNALKRRHRKSSLGSTNILPWKYQSEMEFLLPHFRSKSTNSAAANASDDSIIFLEQPESPCSNASSPAADSSSVRSVFSAVAPSPKFLTRNKQKENELNDIKDIVEIIKSSNNKRKADMDETDYFFLSMSKQIQKLPKRDQSNIKFQLHKLVHDAEIRMIMTEEHLITNNETQIFKIDIGNDT